MNQMAEGLIGFTAKLDMVGEPLWIPYQDTTEVATLFRIMWVAAPECPVPPLLTLSAPQARGRSDRTWWRYPAARRRRWAIPLCR
jgi:hypothetical protein